MKKSLIIVILIISIPFLVFSNTSCFVKKTFPKTSPTIELKICEGPDYITGFCVYRVEAVVTGNPKPKVTFSRNDGKLGKDRCQINLDSPQESYLLEATAKNLMGEATTSLLLEWGCEEETEDELIEEAEEEKETENELTEVAEEEKETKKEDDEKGMPTIELVIYQGPLYSSFSHKCYYRVKANVTGIPLPNIKFSKDDSNGFWGKSIVQVNLNDPTDTYNLTATAINSKGSASDSINLSWGCIDLEDLENNIINLINSIRAQNGLNQLSMSQSLTDIARSRSTDMIINSYFSHYTPDGRNILNILRENGVSYINAGENICQATPASHATAEATVSSWMASPSHKENILRSVYGYIGVGIIEEENRRVITAVFLN